MTRIIFPLLLTVAALVSSPAFSQSATAPIEVAPDAPDMHTVVPGDTLWGISGRFLSQPWRWPEVWRLNRDQISNPHLIYPGQVIMLDRSGPYLTVGRRLTGEDERLSPRIYTEELGAAIPSIPIHLIEPFLVRPLVVDDAQLSESGTVIATETSRVYLGTGDTVFAKDIPPTALTTWQIYRRATPIVDPLNNELLGYEARHLGSARVSAQDDEVTTLEITNALEEIGVGDRLMQSERPQNFAYVPRAPELDLDGRIIGIHRGVAETGRHAVVMVNLGSYDGVDEGHVLTLHRNRGTAVFKEDGQTETYALPEKRYGLMFVFRVFDRVSYGLIMDSDGHVSIGDAVRTP